MFGLSERLSDRLIQNVKSPTVSCFSKIQIGLPFWHQLAWVVLDEGLLNGCC